MSGIGEKDIPLESWGHVGQDYDGCTYMHQCMHVNVHAHYFLVNLGPNISLDWEDGGIYAPCISFQQESYMILRKKDQYSVKIASICEMSRILVGVKMIFEEY